MRVHTFTAACSLLAMASIASAGGVDFDFMEQNDLLNNSYTSADTAGVLTMDDPDLIGMGHIQPGDVDWFAFTLLNDASLQFATGATTSLPYGMSLQMLDSAGNVIVGDAEQGPGDSSPVSIQATMLAAGTYFVGISGFDPDVNGGNLLDGIGNSGAHTFDFTYALSLEATPSVSVVPLPAAGWAGLGLLLPLGVARRMRRRD